MPPFVLPTHCTIRPAVKDDRWALQKLVLHLIWLEALGFDARLIIYRISQISLLVVFIAVQVWFFRFATPIWQSVIGFTLLLTALWAIALSLILLLHIVLIPIEPLFNWSMYWVVECNQRPVGCAAVLYSDGFCVLYHVVVERNWRKQKLASCLVQQVVRVTKSPLYLVCRPAVVPFYSQLGFEVLAWKHLSKPLRTHFKDFIRDRDICRVNWQIMACSHDSTVSRSSQ